MTEATEHMCIQGCMYFNFWGGEKELKVFFFFFKKPFVSLSLIVLL